MSAKLGMSGQNTQRTDRAKKSTYQAGPDLRILIGLLTGHHIMGLHQDSVCPLCQEEEDTTAQCSALMPLWKNILED